MNLTKEDKIKIEKAKEEIDVLKLSLTSGNFYVKYRDIFDLRAISEIIISKVAQILGLVCPKYYLYIPVFKENDENECFIISEDIESIGPFNLASSLGIGANTNASVKESLNVLENYYGNNPILLKDVMAMYLLSLFFGFNDFHNKNWGVIKKNEEERIVILDNEHSFQNDIKPKMSSFPTKIDYDLEVDLSSDEPLKINIAYFLENSSDDLLSLFEAMYYLFTPEYLAKVLEVIEKEEVIITKEGFAPLKIPKDDILKRYQKIYNVITEAWQEHNKKRGKK